ncbi:MFS transporter [uncultured Shewanella sp.]|uniref:MFS transporter n=1 Tax=uncultured Shewanella sp. TaxID=173975 RepID=UPI002608607E|nr:MFS transporter [uncultured Shewanella sp.]
MRYFFSIGNRQKLYLAIQSKQLVSIAYVIATNLVLLAGDILKFSASIYVFEIEGSVMSFSLLAIAALLPGFIIFPLIGAALDKFSKQKLIYLSIFVFWLALLSLKLAINHNDSDFSFILVLMCVISFVEASLQLSLASILPNITENVKLGKLNSLNEMLRASSMFISPIVAAGLFSVISMSDFTLLALVISAISFLIFGVFAIDESKVNAQKIAHTIGLVDGYKSALRCILRHKGLLAVLMLFVYSNFANGVFLVLMFPLTLTLGSVEDAGLYRAALALGMVLGGVLLSQFINRILSYVPILLAISVPLVLISLFALYSNNIVNSFLLFSAGCGIAMANGLSQTLWQLNTPEHLRGKVFALRRLVAFSVLPIAYLCSPFITDGFQQLNASFGHEIELTSAMQFTLISTCLLSLTFVLLQLRNISLIRETFSALDLESKNGI